MFSGAVLGHIQLIDGHLAMLLRKIAACSIMLPESVVCRKARRGAARLQSALQVGIRGATVVQVS
jgi:hypothetical protein